MKYMGNKLLLLFVVLLLHSVVNATQLGIGLFGANDTKGARLTLSTGAETPSGNLSYSLKGLQEVEITKYNNFYNNSYEGKVSFYFLNAFFDYHSNDKLEMSDVVDIGMGIKFDLAQDKNNKHILFYDVFNRNKASDLQHTFGYTYNYVSFLLDCKMYGSYTFPDEQTRTGLSIDIKILNLFAVGLTIDQSTRYNVVDWKYMPIIKINL